MQTLNPPKFIERDKIFKAKDIIVALKYFGASFDKLKTSTPNRARAIVLGYKAWRLGLNEIQLRTLSERKIDDKEIIDILGYKEKKSIRKWSIFTKVKEDDYRIKVERLWCKKLGALCLLMNLDQKALITLAQERFSENLDCTIPDEF